MAAAPLLRPHARPRASSGPTLLRPEFLVRTLAAPAKEYDALADAAIRESAREAYSHSYAPHHNRVVRAIARKVFDFLPSREVFYRALGDAGADRKRWDRDLKRDMEQCLTALRPTVKRLKRHFAEGAPQGA